MQLVKIFKTVTFKETFYLYSNSAMVAPGSLHGGPPCLIGGLLHNLKKRATLLTENRAQQTRTQIREEETKQIHRTVDLVGGRAENTIYFGI